MLVNPLPHTNIINDRKPDSEQSVEDIPHLLVQGTTFGNLAAPPLVSTGNPLAFGKSNRAEFVKELKQFNMFEDGTPVGSFDISHILKYVLSLNNTETRIGGLTLEETLITKYLFTAEHKDNGFIKFNIVNTHPITTNYNNMINLSRSLVEYEEMQLHNILPIKDPRQTFLIKRFIINVLEYTIKMIAIIVDTQNIPQESKMKLFSHSVILHGYATKYIVSKLDEHHESFVSFNTSLSNISSVQSTIDNKQIKLDTLLCQQNSLLTTALEKCVKHDNKDVKVSAKSVANSIRDLTDKIHELDLSESSSSQKGGSKKNKPKIYKTVTDSDDNNFNENYNDSDDSPPVNIQKIESSNCSALLNM